MPRAPSGHVGYHELQASTTVTASGNSGSGIALPPPKNGFCWHVDLTDTDLVVGDLIDIKLQTSVDGVQWFDVAAITQAVGTAVAVQYLMKIAAAVDQNAQIFDDRFSTIAANNTHNMIGTMWRVRWIIAGVSPAFTFSSKLVPI